MGLLFSFFFFFCSHELFSSFPLLAGSEFVALPSAIFFLLLEGSPFKKKTGLNIFAEPISKILQALRLELNTWAYFSKDQNTFPEKPQYHYHTLQNLRIIP